MTMLEPLQRGRQHEKRRTLPLIAATNPTASSTSFPFSARKQAGKRIMWSTWSESAKSSITSALEKTGDVISKAATNARHLGENAPAAPIVPAHESGGGGNDDETEEAAIPASGSSDRLHRTPATRCAF